MRQRQFIFLALVVLIGAGGRMGGMDRVSATSSGRVHDHLQAYLQRLGPSVQRDAETSEPRPLGGDRLHAEALVQRFYQQRFYAPAWVDENGPLSRADTLIAALYGLDAEGLDPHHYHLMRIETTLRQVRQEYESDKEVNSLNLTELELLLSDAFLATGTHLVASRFRALDNIVDSANAPRIDVVAHLQQALQDQTLADSLHRLIPSQAGYLRLREALRRYRRIASRGGWRQIVSGRLLRLGDRGERVADLRSRLRITRDLESSGSLKAGEADEVFDAEVEQAVQAFQRRHGLEVDGVVGPNTLAALNVTVDDRIRQLVLNLERWRQSQPDFGDSYLYVNIPDYTLNVVENGRSAMTMRVVVGKPQWRTPTFRSTMTYLVLNPYWVVPQRIGREEIIPRVKENPEYLGTQQMELIEGWGATARVVDPSIIDWTTVSKTNFPYRFRQQPGHGNALGRVKFKFSNPYSIYMHDTPARSLFAKSKRAFSHGCVRLEQPLELATFLLRETSWTPERVAQMLERGQRSYVNLPRPIDVHIVYHTAWMDENGVVHFRPDIYGHDKSQQKVLCHLSKYTCA